MSKKNVALMFQNEMRYGESIANAMAGSSGAIRPQDPVNWAEQSARTGTVFPYELMQSQARALKNSNARNPLYGIQPTKGTLQGFAADLAGFLTGFDVFPGTQSAPGNTGVVRPNTPGSTISPYDIGSGRIVPVNDPSYDPNLDPNSPLYDNLKGEVDKQVKAATSGGGLFDSIIGHYTNAGQNIALAALAIGLILLGGYAVLK